MQSMINDSEYMSTSYICMVEDELNISDFVSRGLKDFGYEINVFHNGQEAWNKLKADNRYDLLLLDIRMPGMTGLEICQHYREKYGYHTPILMLTALGTTEDIVMGLHAGADDYVVKPFKFAELIARIKAMLRRTQALQQNSLIYHDLTIDPSTHKAIRNNIEADLSVKEYRLLEYMMQHHGEVISRRQLLKDVWDKDFDTNTNIVDVYVKYLRTKIDDPFKTKLIHTIIGMGYMLK